MKYTRNSQYNPIVNIIHRNTLQNKATSKFDMVLPRETIEEILWECIDNDSKDPISGLYIHFGEIFKTHNPNAPSVDRVNNDMGYHPLNVRITLRQSNQQRGDMHIDSSVVVNTKTLRIYDDSANDWNIKYFLASRKTKAFMRKEFLKTI